MDKYPDLRANGIKTEDQAIRHWITYGEKEGRSYINNISHINPPIHFITYGNDLFEKAKLKLVNQAKIFYPFKTIYGYGPKDLSEDFKQEFKNILDMPRGGGYWIWKLNILQQKLVEINDNEILVYLDAGSTLNKNGISRFNEYIYLLDNSEFGVLSFQINDNQHGGQCKEICYTTKEIFNYFNIDLNNNIANNGQYINTCLILKKNKHLMDLIELYFKALYDNPMMFTDYYNNMNQHPDFIDNRHDQSVFSILRKVHGSVVVHCDETWMVPFGEGKSLKYPFWSTRIKE